MTADPTLIHEVMPRWTVRERHHRVTSLPPGDLIDACWQVSWREVPLLRRLTFGRFAGRPLDPDQPVVSGFTKTGPYEVLGSSSRELVIGLLMPARGTLTEPPARTTADTFATPPVSGEVRIALGFRADGGGIATETRVCADGARAKVGLLCYWSVIRAPSGLIRRQWLKAVIDRAAAQPSPRTTNASRGRHLENRA